MMVNIQEYVSLSSRTAFNSSRTSSRIVLEPFLEFLTGSDLEIRLKFSTFLSFVKVKGVRPIT